MKTALKIQVAEQFIGKDIYQFTLERYGEEIAGLLKGKESRNLAGATDTQYNQDNRSRLEYMQEILLGWIVEDYLREQINDSYTRFEMYNVGTDKERKFLNVGQISSCADLLLLAVQDKNRIEKHYIEVICDYDNYWSSHGVGHLRDVKLLELIEKSKKESVYILAVDMQKKTCGLIQVIENIKRRYIPKHKGFGKRAWEIPIDTKYFVDKDNITQLFYSLVEKHAS